MQTEKVKRRSELRDLPSVPDVNYRSMGAPQSAELVNPLLAFGGWVASVGRFTFETFQAWISNMTNTRTARSRQNV